MATFLGALVESLKPVAVTCSCTNCGNNDCLAKHAPLPEQMMAKKQMPSLEKMMAKNQESSPGKTMAKKQDIAESCSCEECSQSTCLYRNKKAVSAKTLDCDCDMTKIKCNPTIKELNTTNLYEICKKTHLTTANKYIDESTELPMTNPACKLRKYRDVCSATSATAVCICTQERRQQTIQTIPPIQPAPPPTPEPLQDSPVIMKLPKPTCEKKPFLPTKSCCNRVETSNNAFAVFKRPANQGPKDYLKGAAGYVFEVPKHDVQSKQQKNDTKSHGVEIPVKPYEIIKEPEKQDSPDYLKGAAGYVFEVPKSNEKLEVEKFLPDTHSSDTTVEAPHNPYVEKKEKNVLPDFLKGAAGCVIDLPIKKEIKHENSPDSRKKRRVSDKQVFNINRLETKRIACDTLHNFYKQNSSQCNNLAIKKSEFSEDFGKIQQYKPTKNAQELFKNILETQGNTIKMLTNTIYQEKNSKCNVYSKILESQSSGYVHERPKCSHNFTTQKNSEWLKSAQNNSESQGCEPELQAFTKFTYEPRNNSQVFGIFETKLKAISKDKIIKRTCDCKERIIMPIESTNQTKSGAGREPGKHKSIPQEPSIYCDRKPQTQKLLMVYECRCHECLKKDCKDEPQSTAKVLELPKSVHETPETDSLKSTVFCQGETKSIQSDTHNIGKNMTGTQTNINDLYKDILKTQMDSIEALKKVYLPEKVEIQSKPNKSNASISCSEMPRKQSDSIKVLKKVYLPQKYAAPLPYDDNVNSTCCLSCLPPKLCETSTLKFICSTDQLATTSHNSSAHCSSSRTGVKVTDTPSEKSHDSLARIQKTNTCNKSKILSKFDIFMRLREAYMACSCKICECVSGKSVKPEGCRCVACPSNLKRNNVQLGTCDCKVCDCESCNRSFAEQCNCEPCQCGDCKMKITSQRQRQMFVVAPVGIEENVQRVTCTCTPCDCIECQLIYPLTSIMHEMSTSTARHSPCRCEICLNENCGRNGYESCNCQKSNQVMRKPVEQDTHDFDIRTAMIIHSKPTYLRWRDT